MALQDTTSQPHVSTLLAHLTGDARAVAFRTGNPTLASEVEALTANPRRIRKLNADAAVEAISWIDDPAVVEAIVEVDPRVAVLERARTRMSELSRSLVTFSNERNTRERTARAIAKEPRSAISSLQKMTAVDNTAVLEWLDTLSDDVLPEALVMALDHGSLSGEPALYPKVAATVQRLGSKSQMLLDAVCAHQRAASATVDAWVGPYDATMAHVVASVFHYLDNKAVPVINDSCREVWEDMKRIDLLLWADAIPVSAIPAVFTHIAALDGYAIQRVMRSAHNPDVIASLVNEAQKAGWFSDDQRNKWRWDHGYLTEYLRIPGLDRETVNTLVSFVMDDDVATYVVSEGVTDEVLALVARTHSAEDIVNAGRHMNGFEQGVDRLVEALFDHSSTLPKYQTRRRHYWSSLLDVESGIARRVADALGSSEQAWLVFWTLHATAEAVTYRELVEAALALDN